MSLTHEKRLAIVSKAWGRQSGYAFFPHISGKARNREQRIESYSEGPAFLWPQEKAKILAWMRAHEADDLYWCPSLFERDRRQMEFAMDEHCLWADLDDRDPRTVDDYPPTVAWETSPGSYQALWLLQPGSGDLQGASWEGGENQRLTYHLGADSGGWDTTQLLRLPEWPNHKPERRGGERDGKPKQKLDPPAQGRLLWASGRTYMPDDFEDLPEVERAGAFEAVLEDQVEAVDVGEAWSRVRLKVSSEVRELFAVREASGDRSDKLWQMERDLADAGCTASEIVALVRSTVWNKFVGRNDELKRLTLEAAKAIAERPPEVEARVELERAERPKPDKLGLLVKTVRAPRWLVRGAWTQGACGFIAGQPKSFKSWFALDLALSVAAGSPFLDKFQVVEPGPVLYVQEEDALPTVKVRYDKMWPNRRADKMMVDAVEGDDGVWWVPPAEAPDLPDVDAYVGHGVRLSDPVWQGWLDEAMAEGGYRLVVLDPLMLMAGDLEENKSSAVMEKVLSPLKQLSRKHGAAICLVHHMRKAGRDQGPRTGMERSGANLLGAQAYHAWSEDSLYLSPIKGGARVELESKFAPPGEFDVVGLRNMLWTPKAGKTRGLFEDQVENEAGGVETRKGRRPSAVKLALESLGPGHWSTAELRGAIDKPISGSAVWQQLQRLEEAGEVAKTKIRGKLAWSLAP